MIWYFDIYVIFFGNSYGFLTIFRWTMKISVRLPLFAWSQLVQNVDDFLALQTLWSLKRTNLEEQPHLSIFMWCEQYYPFFYCWTFFFNTDWILNFLMELNACPMHVWYVIRLVKYQYNRQYACIYCLISLEKIMKIGYWGYQIIVPVAGA